MGMTRADARTYLADVVSDVLADAGVGTTDTTGALKAIIDNALLMVGTAYDDLATAEITGTNEINGYRAVLEYVCLSRCWNAILKRKDLQVDGPQMSVNWSQTVRQMENRIKAARDDATPFMSTGDFAVGVVTFDFLEPVEVA